MGRNCEPLANSAPDWGVGTSRQLRETVPEAGPYRYVIQDHDAKFDAEVVAFLQGTGLSAKRTSIRSRTQYWLRSGFGSRLALYG